MVEKKIYKGGIPYSGAIKVNDTLYISGQVPIENNRIPEDITEQTFICLNKIKDILVEAEGSVGNLVKMTIFLKNYNEIEGFRRGYIEFFTNNGVTEFPASSAMVVSSLFSSDWKIEIEGIAVI